MRKSVHDFVAEAKHRAVGEHRRASNPFGRFQAAFERKFEQFRESYRNTLAWTLSQPMMTVIAFMLLIVVSSLLFRCWAGISSASGCRTDAPARARPAGTRIEKTQEYFAAVEAQIRQIVGNDQIDVMLDNIGLPYSGINIALSDSATVGPMDGEILISLTKKHTTTAKLIGGSAGRIARTIRRSAVFLSACRHRRSGAQLRPAGADRRQDIRTGPRCGVFLGVGDCACNDAGARRG